LHEGERSSSKLNPSQRRAQRGSSRSLDDYACEVDEFPFEETKEEESTLEYSAFGLVNETIREKPNGKSFVESVRVEAKKGHQRYTSDTLFDHKRKEITLKVLKLNDPRKCGCKEFLIVDDNDFNRLVLKTHIKPFGFASQEAMNGEQAIQRIIEQSK